MAVPMVFSRVRNADLHTVGVMPWKFSARTVAARGNSPGKLRESATLSQCRFSAFPGFFRGSLSRVGSFPVPRWVFVRLYGVAMIMKPLVVKTKCELAVRRTQRVRYANVSICFWKNSVDDRGLFLNRFKCCVRSS